MELKCTYAIPLLPLQIDLETKHILKKAIAANKALAELNGIAKIIPNQKILINSLTLQEAKDSSAIENIITTYDDLYKAEIDIGRTSVETKEVQNYKSALLKGYDLVQKRKNLIINDIAQVQANLENNDAGVRKTPGVALKNEQTQEIVYVPPQDHKHITELLTNLENYLNSGDEIDPLIKMSLIHHQFESIHPFSDGNGRTGRILNILYLVSRDLLDMPILYLSGYIVKTKGEYYRLLQKVRDEGDRESWILYMLEGIEKTSLATIGIIKTIHQMMTQTKEIIKEKLPNTYSKDLLEILFQHPFSKIEFLVDGLGVTRQTASKYLLDLKKIGILEQVKKGTTNYYINIGLFNIFKKGLQFE